MPASTYLALGLSTDGTTLVEQPVRPGPRCGKPTFTCPLAALEAQGSAFAAAWLGTVLLQLLPVDFPLCARLQPPPAQVAAIARDRLIPVSMAATPIRPAHLRLSAAADPDRLLIEYERPLPAAPRASVLLLAALALSGPSHAADRVGRTALHALAELHPDVFARYPQLTAEPPAAA